MGKELTKNEIVALNSLIHDRLYRPKELLRKSISEDLVKSLVNKGVLIKVVKGSLGAKVEDCTFYKKAKRIY